MSVRTLPTRAVFLSVLACVLAGYTVLAWGLAWRMPSGQIGPGFFPRLIGAAALVGCLVALGQTLRAPVESADASPAHSYTLVAVVSACVGFFVLLVVAGALVAGVVFLSGVLMVLNPGRQRLLVNAAVGVGLPVVLYVLFAMVLDAQLPAGIF
jgi:putative tricarboxylic transport membrane protein